ILLILLTDQISAAYQAGRRAVGDWAPTPVTVGDLFAGALLPGLMLVVFYLLYILVIAKLNPAKCPPVKMLDSSGDRQKLTRGFVAQALLMPLVLILIVLGSILMGVATATESAALGAAGALVMAALENKDMPRWRKLLMFAVLPGALLLVAVKFAGGAQASVLLAIIGTFGLVVMSSGTLLALWQEHRAERVMPVARETASLVAMLVLIVLGATMLSLVFRGFHGEELVRDFLQNLPGGVTTAIVFTMVVIFLLGFIIEYVEIIFIVIPIAGPPLMELGVDPVWFAILISMNLQMSFLTPPFGYALFYFRRVAPVEISTADIYRGIIPFVCLQLAALAMVAMVPGLATWLPRLIYN
ncbi:MAG TPA: TRAP transporter large permease subunit, partial [Paracoccaceae bacterium]|nr:TRAP transporter large permease subunit [Paracoccaceae bacterium]